MVLIEIDLQKMMFFSLFSFPYSFQYRILLNKIDQIEKSYIKPVLKSDLMSASFSELLKDLSADDQKFFFINSLKWLAKHHPKTHQSFLQKTFTGLVKPLDHYSEYLSPLNLKNTIKMGQGKMAGIGVELLEKNGAIEIVGVRPGSPAYKAKLKVGDVISHINSKKITPQKEMVIQKLRGEIGSFSHLTIQRKNKTFNVDLKRQMIRIESIHSKIYKDILYIRINYFSENIHFDIKNLLIENQNIKGCIVDIRNNPGGLFKESIMMTELFLNKGCKILEIREKNSSKIFYSQREDLLEGKPLVVLINQASASSSEIMAGCLKNAKRAVLIGQKTLGKGTIQNVIPIFPSVFFGGIKYTTAEVFTSSGASIQDTGIEPDLYVAGEIIYNPKSMDDLYKKDVQFKKGVDLLLK